MANTDMQSVPDLYKLKPLNRNNYKRWSQRILLRFEQSDIDYVLFQDLPKLPVQFTRTETTSTVASFEPASIQMSESAIETVTASLPESVSELASEIYDKMPKSDYLETI